MKKKKKEDSNAEANLPVLSNEEKGSEVTLSGLLNFTDGLWSSCGSERIFVYTTNHIEKLDPALLRSGRMDMHIHLSYCGFEAFKVLAKNYLKLEDHALFEEVRAAMQDEGVRMTPADVSEVMTREKCNPEQALRCLIKELWESKFKKQESKEEEDETEEQKEATPKEEDEPPVKTEDSKAVKSKIEEENGEVSMKAEDESAVEAGDAKEGKNEKLEDKIKGEAEFPVETGDTKAAENDEIEKEKKKGTFKADGESPRATKGASAAKNEAEAEETE